MAATEQLDALRRMQTDRQKRRDRLNRRLASRTGKPGYEANCAELRKEVDALDIQLARFGSDIARIEQTGSIEYDL